MVTHIVYVVMAMEIIISLSAIIIAAYIYMEDIVIQNKRNSRGVCYDWLYVHALKTKIDSKIKELVIKEAIIYYIGIAHSTYFHEKFNQIRP